MRSGACYELLSPISAIYAVPSQRHSHLRVVEMVTSYLQHSVRFTDGPVLYTPAHEARALPLGQEEECMKS